MLSFQEFVDSRKSRPTSAGQQLQRSKSARSASHHVLAALDQLKLQRSSTSKSLQDPEAPAAGNATFASGAAAGAAQLRSARCSSFTGTAAGGAAATAAAAAAGEGQISITQHNAPGSRQLSRTSTIHAAYTTTTVDGGDALDSDRRASAGASTASSATTRLVQPLSVADALCSPRGRRASSAAHIAAASSAPPAESTAGRYAGAIGAAPIQSSRMVAVAGRQQEQQCLGALAASQSSSSVHIAGSTGASPLATAAQRNRLQHSITSASQREWGGTTMLAAPAAVQAQHRPSTLHRSYTSSSQRMLSPQISSRAAAHSIAEPRTEHSGAPEGPAKQAALQSLQHQQEQLQHLLRHVSRPSQGSMCSRLSHAASATADEAAQAAAPASVPDHIRHEAGTAQLQQESSSVAAAHAQQGAALHGLQQQLAQMQGGLRQALSQSATGSPKLLSKSLSSSPLQLEAGGTEALPNPRVSQPKPYPAAVERSCGSTTSSAAAAAASETIKQLRPYEHSTAGQVSQAAEAAAVRQQAVDPVSMNGQKASCAPSSGSSRGHISIAAQQQDVHTSSQRTRDSQVLDVTFSGGVPAAETSAFTASMPGSSSSTSPRGSASESGSDVESSCSGRRGGSPELCSSALFIEPSTTVCDDDIADLAFFRTPDVRARVGKHANAAPPAAAAASRPDRQHSLHSRAGQRQAEQHAMYDDTSEADDGRSFTNKQAEFEVRRQQKQTQHTHPRHSRSSTSVGTTETSYGFPDSKHHQYSVLARHKPADASIGRAMRSRSASPYRGTAATAAKQAHVAAAVGYDADVDAAPGDSHMVLVVRQHAKQLQQQNDALVRVLEREQQEHKKSKQKAVDAQQQLAESRAEWEVALQVLRQEKVAVKAQLRKALAGNHAEVFDAFDAALAASAAQVQEAQAAAATLAAQLADCELQLQQHSNQAAGNRPGNPVPAADALAAAAAVESHAARTGSTSNRSPSSHASGPLAALRQHQKSIEKQLAKQHAELTKLQRENLRLMRFKEQFESAGQKLKEAAAAQAAAEAAGQQAGLKAAAEAGRAERLQQQVAGLQLEKQQMQASQQALEQQMAAFQQQLQQLQQEMHVGAALGRCSPVLRGLAGVDACSGLDTSAADAAVAAAEQQSTGSSSHHSRHSSSSASSAAAVAGTFVKHGSYEAASSKHITTSIHASDSSNIAGKAGSAGRSFSRSSSAFVDASPSQQPHLRHSTSLPARRGRSSSSSSSSAALALAQHMAKALPGQPDSSLQGQMASLMSAIAAGVEERKALTAQGQVLLEMVTGGSRASL
uniref:Uncharacterized protein n=1 Tax=Tetradesmus obliquus TaxID=3088 RepID=A0A383WA50_TETOB|eukprot:jgi/Sobl393_1/6712/SZX74507.1